MITTDLPAVPRRRGDRMRGVLLFTLLGFCVIAAALSIAFHLG